MWWAGVWSEATTKHLGLDMGCCSVFFLDNDRWKSVELTVGYNLCNSLNHHSVLLFLHNLWKLKKHKKSKWTLILPQRNLFFFWIIQVPSEYSDLQSLKYLLTGLLQENTYWSLCYRCPVNLRNSTSLKIKFRTANEKNSVPLGDISLSLGSRSTLHLLLRLGV